MGSGLVSSIATRPRDSMPPMLGPLQAAIRRNRRRLALPAFVQGVRRTLGDDFDVEGRLVDLATTAALEGLFGAGLVTLRERELGEGVRTSDATRVGIEARRFVSGHESAELIVLASHWTHVGALRLTSAELAAGAAALLAWDGDTIFGGTEDRRAVFLFDVRCDDGVERYEILHSGSDSFAAGS
jgi:hypothetical protein